MKQYQQLKMHLVIKNYFIFIKNIKYLFVFFIIKEPKDKEKFIQLSKNFLSAFGGGEQ